MSTKNKGCTNAGPASLPADLASGPHFHVSEPVESDGLMHHYVIDSRFGASVQSQVKTVSQVATHPVSTVGLTSEEEVQVFLQSTRLLACLHAHAQLPVARILAGLRLPTAQTSDGHIIVIGAFDAVYRTEDVATSRGWDVHDNAEEALSRALGMEVRISS